MPEWGQLPRWMRLSIILVSAIPNALAVSIWAERGRWSLWTPAALGGGVGVYFTLSTEPPLWVGLATLAFFSGIAVFLWRSGRVVAVPVAMLAIGAFGYVLIQARSEWNAAPVLERPIGPVEIDGRVIEIEPDGGRVRVTLAGLSIERVSPEKTPNRIRISMSRRWAPDIGARIRVVGRLMPPPVPAAPGTFDFPRQAWFEGLGGVGYAIVRPEVLGAAAITHWGMIKQWVESQRMDVAQRLSDGIGGASGGVAAALATGTRGLVPKDVIEAYRASGLAHLLAISGLHMGLAAGLVYVVVRGGLALSPAIALRWNIKKITAAIAMLLMVFYLILAGGGVPAQRAFLMGCVVLIAVMVDRSAFTLRTLMVAALVVLLVQPESLIGPSFQMSFAAVAGLVAAYEVGAPALSRWRIEASSPAGAFLRAILAYAAGILFSTLIAGLATAPYAAFHFHRLSVWGVAANMAAMPIMAVWVMPWLVVALLLMPFGLDGWTMVPLRLGLDMVEIVARTVAAWPAAMVGVPPVSTGVLAVVTVAGLWLCLWKGRWRHVAWPVLVVACFMPWTRVAPDVVVSSDGALIAVQGSNGIVLLPGRRDTFERRLWTELWGEAHEDWPVPGGDPESTANIACDDRGCLYWRNGQTISVVWHQAALLEDCAMARAVVSLAPVRPGDCPAPVLVAPWDLRRKGTHALYLGEDGGIRIENVSDARGQRPWTGIGTAR